MSQSWRLRSGRPATDEDRIVELGIKEVAGGGQRRFVMPAAAFVPLQPGMRPHWGALVEPTAT